MRTIGVCDAGKAKAEQVTENELAVMLTVHAAAALVMR